MVNVKQTTVMRKMKSLGMILFPLRVYGCGQVNLTVSFINKNIFCTFILSWNIFVFCLLTWRLQNSTVKRTHFTQCSCVCVCVSFHENNTHFLFTSLKVSCCFFSGSTWGQKAKPKSHQSRKFVVIKNESFLLYWVFFFNKNTEDAFIFIVQFYESIYML